MAVVVCDSCLKTVDYKRAFLPAPNIIHLLIAELPMPLLANPNVGRPFPIGPNSEFCNKCRARAWRYFNARATGKNPGNTSGETMDPDHYKLLEPINGVDGPMQYKLN